MELGPRFWSKVDTSGECWVWTASKNPKGYGKYALNGSWLLAHKASYEAKHGVVPDEKMLLHNCDTPSCVRPSHMQLGTAMKNNQDAYDRLRANGLTWEKVREIRSQYSGKRGQITELARDYGVHRTTISQVVKNLSWEEGK